MGYPKYVSHKEVGAAKIAAVDQGADGSVTVELEGDFDKVVISHHDKRHKPEPQVGMYLVQYADGYISFSPAAQFEDGYTLLDPVVEAQPGLAAAQQSTAAPVHDDENEVDDDEDEEVVDAANNHGQAEAVAD